MGGLGKAMPCSLAPQAELSPLHLRYQTGDWWGQRRALIGMRAESDPRAAEFAAGFPAGYAVGCAAGYAAECAAEYAA